MTLPTDRLAVPVAWVRAAFTDLVAALLLRDDPEPAPGRPVRSRRLRWLRRSASSLLVALALVLAMVSASNTHRVSTVVAVLIGAASALPLLLLLRHSLWAWRFAWVAALVLGVIDDVDQEGTWPWNPVQTLVLAAVLMVVAARHDRGVLIWVWLTTSALTWGFFDRGEAPAMTLAVAGLMVFGYQVGRRRQAQSRLADEQERGAVLVERARIARELHDVVAHHMSLIAVRAESAPYRLPDLPEPARAELAEISDAARSALTEMRRLLGVLRDGETAAPAERAPQPGLADLPALVDAARGAGTPVVLLADDLPAEPLPAAVDVSVYRIVQEALSNAARHAPGSAVSVGVRCDPSAVELRIANGPGREPAGATDGSGHGLRGMRERVGMLGGTVSAGPTGDGGFEVRAVLPTNGGAA